MGTYRSVGLASRVLVEGLLAVALGACSDKAFTVAPLDGGASSSRSSEGSAMSVARDAALTRGDAGASGSRTTGTSRASGQSGSTLPSPLVDAGSPQPGHDAGSDAPLAVRPDGAGDAAPARDAGAPDTSVRDAGVPDARMALDAGAADVSSPREAGDASVGTDGSDGGCSATCAGSCVSGTCVVTLASGQASPSELALDDTFVYWIAGQSILRAPKGGGPTTELVTGQPGMGQLAIDATSLYWEGSTGERACFLASAPLAGGAVTTLVAAQHNVGGIAVDATSIYWVSIDDGTLQRQPLHGGGAAVMLARGLTQPEDVAVNATDAYVAIPTTGVGHTQPGSIVRVPLSGAPAVVFAAADASRVVLDVTSAYWEDADTGALIRQLFAGGGTTTLATVAASSTDVVRLAVFGGELAWTAANEDDAANGAVSEVAVGGGAGATLVAGGQATPYGVATDATGVYWTDFLGGTVMRAVRE